MIDIVKGLWKWLLWILILFVLGCIILAFRIFVIDKDYDGKNSKSKSNISDTTTSSKNSNSGSLGKSIVNGVKTIGNATVQGYKGDGDYTYNIANFDETFLMYEGAQDSKAVKTVCERLIENSNDNFYARTSVTSVGFGNDVSIKYDGSVEEYQNSIRNLEASIVKGMYNISFKYGGLGSYVNEIVITKK